MNKHNLNRMLFLLYRFVLGPLAVVVVLRPDIFNALRAATIGPEFTCVQVFLAYMWFILIEGAANGFRRNYWRETTPGWAMASLTPLPLTLGKLVGAASGLGFIIGSGLLAWWTIDLLYGPISSPNPIAIVLIMFAIGVPMVALMKQATDYVRDEWG